MNFAPQTISILLYRHRSRVQPFNNDGLFMSSRSDPLGQEDAAEGINADLCGQPVTFKVRASVIIFCGHKCLFSPP